MRGDGGVNSIKGNLLQYIYIYQIITLYTLNISQHYLSIIPQ